MLVSRLMEMCRPAMDAPSVLEIDLDALRARGIEALFLDLDNTLVLWRSQEVRDEIAEWVRKAQAAGLKLAIVSNAGHARRVEPVARALGIPFTVRAAKPRRGAFRKAAADLGLPPRKVAVIGDQVLTDVLGGNRAGMLTILVSPIDRRREFVWTKCMRVLERAIRKHHTARPQLP